MAKKAQYEYGQLFGRPAINPTPEQIESFASNRKVGLSLRNCAFLMMVRPSTLEMWLQQGKRDFDAHEITPKAELFVHDSLAQARYSKVFLIKLQEHKDWKAWVKANDYVEFGLTDMSAVRASMADREALGRLAEATDIEEAEGDA